MDRFIEHDVYFGDGGCYLGDYSPGTQNPGFTIIGEDIPWMKKKMAAIRWFRFCPVCGKDVTEEIKEALNE